MRIHKTVRSLINTLAVKEEITEQDALNCAQDIEAYIESMKPREDVSATPEELKEVRGTYDKLEKDHLTGKIFEIMDDTTNHKIMIGVKVKVVSKAYGSEYWLVQSKANETAFVTKKDLGL